MTLSSIALWTGYYLNAPTRYAFREGERITRPFNYGEHGFEETASSEIYERIKDVTKLLIATPLAIAFTPAALLSYSVAQLTSSNRLRIVEFLDFPAARMRQRNAVIMSLNTCLQEGHVAPVSGGVVQPYEPTPRSETRIEALAKWVLNRDPDIFLGQEFMDLNAQEDFMQVMRVKYRFFVMDQAPHTLFLNSGLFVASKYPLKNIEFTSFHREHRYGGCVFVERGAISVDFEHPTRTFKVINTHLNAADDEKALGMRHTQLGTYIMPHMKKLDAKPTILTGDFNFNTKHQTGKEGRALIGFDNIFEDDITWTTRGMKHLRGDTNALREESIDAMISNSDTLELCHKTVELVTEDDALLTDHFAISAQVRFT